MNFWIFFIIVNVLIWIPWTWRYCLKPYKVKKQLTKEFKAREDYPYLIKNIGLLISLYQGMNTYNVSREARNKLALEDNDFIYGEIEFMSFFTILESLTPQKTDIFYDLGSGCGKAVFAAALFFDFRKTCGVELLPPLVEFANMQKEKLKKIISPPPTDYQQKVARIHFVCNNFLTYDFLDGTIIFINATSFNLSTWEQLVAKLTLLKSGTRVITTTKKLLHPSFTLLAEKRELMSWGMNSVHIYVKK